VQEHPTPQKRERVMARCLLFGGGGALLYLSGSLSERGRKVRESFWLFWSLHPFPRLAGLGELKCLNFVTSIVLDLLKLIMFKLLQSKLIHLSEFFKCYASWPGVQLVLHFCFNIYFCILQLRNTREPGSRMRNLASTIWIRLQQMLLTTPTNLVAKFWSFLLVLLISWSTTVMNFSFFFLLSTFLALNGWVTYKCKSLFELRLSL